MPHRLQLFESTDEVFERLPLGLVALGIGLVTLVDLFDRLLVIFDPGLHDIFEHLRVPGPFGELLECDENIVHQRIRRRPVVQVDGAVSCHRLQQRADGVGQHLITF